MKVYNLKLMDFQVDLLLKSLEYYQYSYNYLNSDSSDSNAKLQIKDFYKYIVSSTVNSEEEIEIEPVNKNTNKEKIYEKIRVI